MSTILEIERAVRELSTDDLSRFRAWFLEFDARLWDEQIEGDVASGRLRELAEEARADLRAGRTRPL
jgi:phage FluMu protein gp41